MMYSNFMSHHLCHLLVYRWIAFCNYKLSWMCVSGCVNHQPSSFRINSCLSSIYHDLHSSFIKLFAFSLLPQSFLILFLFLSLSKMIALFFRTWHLYLRIKNNKRNINDSHLCTQDPKARLRCSLEHNFVVLLNPMALLMGKTLRW